MSQLTAASYAQVAGAIYSIPFRYRGDGLNVGLTKTRVELFRAK